MKRIVLAFFLVLLFFTLDIGLGSLYLPYVGNQPFQKKIRDRIMNSNRVKSSRFHHGFTPNSVVPYQWGGEEYTIYIDSLGMISMPPLLRTNLANSQVLGSDTDDVQPTTTLLLGDSFTEGIGVPYEKTFAGLLTQHVASQSGTIMNAGVATYSPILYYYKTKYLLEEKHISFDKVMIFLDLSDIYNEYYHYRDYEPDYSAEHESLKYSTEPTTTEQIQGFFTDNSITTNLFYSAYKWYVETQPLHEGEEKIPQWTYKQEYYDEFGKQGLELAAQNMERLIELVRQRGVEDITVVVYPWKVTLYEDSVDSLQAQYWREFSQEQEVGFVDLFPAFFAIDDIDSLFLSDDIHWNENGHRVVFDGVVGEF